MLTAIYIFAVATLLCSLTCARQGLNEPLIGWRGETYDPESVWDPRFKVAEPGVDPERGLLTGSAGAKVVSWDPRVFFYPKFLTKSECRHLIKTAMPQLKKSVVYDSNGDLVVDSIRTSYGTFLGRRQDPAIGNITERVAKLTHVPAVFQEDLQVLRYGKQQYYNAHLDTHSDHFDSPRHITMVIYLVDVEEGGETTFPKTELNDSAWDRENGPFSSCAKGHVSVKPRQGDALMFFSLTPDGTLDEMTKHASCPVLKGTKWTATVWVHTKPWRTESFYDASPEESPADPGICEDNHEKCGTWAAENECNLNPIYMVGEGSTLGHCRKSCLVCEVCSKGDKECYKKNREQAGYLALDEEEELIKAFPTS